ncbi:nuclear factor of activated T-cells 5 isoform X4 [Nasonia vitripennis]|uniref:RHD domain-containing protein n=1 Tax=Nasonia vitripennis TaxID=7425 RepID=A0A7M7QDZ5_NASVI|nr:nuclear factor of activated T-cells 5 isoform X4 [Nasonia vitripennis]
MAPDLEKKREPRRAAGVVVHSENARTDDTGGMQLLQRCSSSFFGDYYRHGTSAGAASTGVPSSTVTGASLRSSSSSRAASSSSSNGSTTAPARSALANPVNTRSRVSQQQQPTQPQPPRSHQPRLPSAGRGSNEQLAASRSLQGSTQDLCDNSNDSGLGFEERQQQHLNKAAAWNGVAGEEDTKRRKMDIKLESEDANFAFPEVVQGVQSESKSASRNSIAHSGRTPINVNGSVGRVVGVTRPRSHLGVLAKRAPPAHQGPVTLTSTLSSLSRNGKTHLQIVCQPEQQHRARYQTEGSRGAVKDRTGNGFPIVRLMGYDKPSTLQVFIGTDLGRVAPHMFYQACRVSGKNSTPCVERKVDGTIVIEVDMDPAKEMLVTCDCVGILKERNVDVEHRFPQEAGILQGRSKKKSTRCRMVFRTTIAHDDGTSETLQVCSQPIVCTQPPGIPEICKKSLTSCPCTGGLELFILGKNFLKDTRVVFQLDSEDLSSSLEPHWECTVLPDKEFLQQTHLVCVVPAYRRLDLAPSETISVKLYAVSSGKTSEPHTFLYTAASAAPAPSVGKIESAQPGLAAANGEVVLASKLPQATSLVVPGSVTSNAVLPAAAGSASFLGAIQPAASATVPAVSPEVLKSDPSPPPVTAASPVTPVMLWSSQSSNQGASADVMMPPPTNMVTNPMMTRRSSSSLQLILPDNLKTEVLDENSSSSLMGDNSMSGMPTSTHNPTAVTSPLEQMVNENSRDSSQSSLIRNTVAANGSPVQDALLGVVDMMRNQHPMGMVTQTSPFNGMHEQSQVKVLSPHHINKDASPIMTSEACIASNMQSPGVVDLRMKHHQPEFNGIGNGNLGSFAATPADQPLPAQSGHSIEKYLNQIESTVMKKTDQDSNFVRASIIASSQQQSPNMLAPSTTNVPLDDLVNSAVDSHQMVSPLRPANSSPNAMINHVAAVVDQHDQTISSPQQTTRATPPIPVKTMLLEALMPSNSVSPLSVDGGNTGPSVPVQVQEPTPDDSLLKSINAALLPTIQESPIVTAATAVAVASVNSSVNVTAHNPLQVSPEVMPSVATAMQALAQDPVNLQQQVQQVEQVVAQAQQQVEQVVAQAQQQAVQAVQTAQQQVVQQVVQHAQVVQQAVQKVQAVQQAPAAPALQQAVQQATQEVVQQAVQQATHEVVQQVQAVQQAVQQAQAAQAMQQAVQQDIGSMLNQPAGFVAEASSALASGAAQEPSQQRLTTAAEQAINNVITNATHDIINNRPITTTTAHAIIATKNILNSVATQSAQLMNSAMEGILPKSPATQQNIVEQVASKSPPTGPIPMQTSSNVAPRQPVVNQQTPMQQNNEPPQAQQVPQQQVQQTQAGVLRKSEATANGMMTQDLMTDHELLSYINGSKHRRIPRPARRQGRQ